MTELRTLCRSIFLMSRANAAILVAALGFICSSNSNAPAAEVTIALPTKSFQQIIFPLALERGYMKEEGIDLKSGVKLLLKALRAGEKEATTETVDMVYVTRKGTEKVSVKDIEKEK